MRYTVEMYGIKIATCFSNHSMSVDDVLDLSCDLSETLREHGIDEWNYEDIVFVQR